MLEDCSIVFSCAGPRSGRASVASHLQPGYRLSDAVGTWITNAQILRPSVEAAWYDHGQRSISTTRFCCRAINPQPARFSGDDRQSGLGEMCTICTYCAVLSMACARGVAMPVDVPAVQPIVVSPLASREPLRVDVVSSSMTNTVTKWMATSS
jgi:hypothetical protein